MEDRPPSPPARGRLRRAAPWIVAVLCASATLGAGFWLKEQCVEGHWTGTMGWYCYSDLGVLWHDRNFDIDEVPYLQEALHGMKGPDTADREFPPGFNEYPPVVAYMQYAAALVTDGHAAWIHVNEAMLALCALGTTLCLVAMTRPSWRPLVFALGPSLALYAFHNWDLAAVFLATAGLFLFMRGRTGWAGALLSLGFHAKIYPILFLPILGMALLREEHGLGRKGWRFGLASVGTLLGVAAPFLLLAPSRFLATFVFHARRGPTVESWWNALLHLAVQWHWTGVEDWITHGGLAITSNLLIAAFLAFFSWAVWRGRLHWLQACLGMLAAFVLLNQVMSVQYALWMLPFLVLLRLPAWLVVAFFATDAWVYWRVMDFFGHSDLQQVSAAEANAHFESLAIATFARAAVYIVLLAWVLFRVRRPERPASLPAPAAAPIPAPAPAPSPAAASVPTSRPGPDSR